MIEGGGGEADDQEERWTMGGGVEGGKAPDDVRQERTVLI